MEKQIEEMAKSVDEALTHNVSWNSNNGVIAYSAEGIARELFDDDYRKISDVAREIFEEIERFLYMHFRFCKEEIGNDDTEYVKGRLELNTQMKNLIAELKKKYTEEGK